MVSSSSRCAPPSIRPRACSRYASRISSNVDGAERGVVDVGRDRQRAVGRAHRAGDEARAIRRPRGPLVGDAARDARALDVDLVGQRLEAVVGLRDRRGRERVGLDDVGAGLEVLRVDAGDVVGLRQDEQIAVALEVVRVIARSASPRKSASVSFEPLDHRAHRAVEHENALGRASASMSRCQLDEVSVAIRYALRPATRLCVPLAMSTVNGSPARREPTRHLDVGQSGARRAARAGRRRRSPSQRSPSCSRTQLRRARAGRAPAHGRRAAATRTASATARAGSGGMVQRLRQQRDIHRRVVERQLFELAALPRDVRRRAGAPPSALARAEHVRRAIDGGDVPRPVRRLDREIALAAADVGDVERRQQMPERARPRRPAAARARAAGRRACRGRRARSKFSRRSRSTSCSRASSACSAAERVGSRRTALRAAATAAPVPFSRDARREAVVGERARRAPR